MLRAGIAVGVRSAEPSFGGDEVARLDSLGALLVGLRELLGEFYQEVHVGAGGRGIYGQLCVAGDFDVFLKCIAREGQGAAGGIGALRADGHDAQYPIGRG